MIRKIEKIIKSILRKLGYKKITSFFQNLFRTRYSLDMYISQSLIVRDVNTNAFAKYRNKHIGQDVVLIATGPSLNKYKPIENAVNIGVNKTIFKKDINLDYYFVIDYAATGSYLKELKNYPNVKKFYATLPYHTYGYKRAVPKLAIIPESLICEHNASKYYIYSKEPVHPLPLNTEIDKTWLADGGSCIFSAMQFALFTNPKKIYLVGCDCSSGYFDGGKGADCSFLIKSWQEIKEFAEIYYPDTEIISVNPVGIKGMFTDLYQE